MNKFKANFQCFEGFICVVLMAFTLGLLTLQVSSRAIGMSNPWSEELARYCFLYMIFLGAAMSAESISHITIETMTRIWPKPIRRYMEILGVLVWIGFCLIVIYYSANFAIMLWFAKRVSLSLYLPMAIPYAAIPIGYIFVAFRIIQRQLIPMLRKKTVIKEEVDV